MNSSPQDSNAIERRQFLKLAATAAGGLALGACAAPRGKPSPLPLSSSATAGLPKGAAPLALSFPHFPDRLNAFVWRNWPLVPVERMALVVGATPAEIRAVAQGMGLGAQPRITADQQARSYITVIKRNWHLLPYEQLLPLLGWSADEMAYALREDDFLFVKLGNLKPQCEPLRYEPPSAEILKRQAQIAEVLRKDLPDFKSPAGEPLFAFVRQLSSKPAVQPRPGASDNLRFCYSYFALYGDPLLDPRADPYPEGFLARLAGAGVNGVWLQGVLYRLARFPWDPAQSAKYEERLHNLGRLVERAAKYGVRVFLYLNEPRAMPLGFFDTRPNLKGVTEGDHAVLCTGVPEVKDYLTESVASICRAVPGLGGFFTISASENLTNCWSHGGGAKCPRCAPVGPAKVVAEANRALYEGVRKSGSSARFIAWDWGWGDDWAPDAIAALPDGMAFMSVSEWRLPLNRGGVRTEVGEYSISAVGPGPRALRHWQLAGARGLKRVAKIQAGNTWELSAVPWIPAIANVARHAENLRQAGVSDVMLGWTLGGYPSPNLEVVHEVLGGASAEQGMSRVAERRFGKTLTPAVVSAWAEFSAAFSEFPYHGGVMYSAPQQVGPANLLWAAPTRYAASMVGFPYDDLDAWRAVYPAPVFAEQLEKVAAGFERAIARLKAAPAASEVSPAEREALEDLCRVAEAARIHFQSTANQARFVMARRAMATMEPGTNTEPQRAEMRRLLRDEIDLARGLWRLQRCDSRLGFEASNHYFYIPIDLAEKILNCRHLLDQLKD